MSDVSTRIDTSCYVHDFHFSQIRNCRLMTQPNPLKAKISDPLPIQPDPTQPKLTQTAGQPNPRTTLPPVENCTQQVKGKSNCMFDTTRAYFDTLDTAGQRQVQLHVRHNSSVFRHTRHSLSSVSYQLEQVIINNKTTIYKAQ